MREILDAINVYLLLGIFIGAAVGTAAGFALGAMTHREKIIRQFLAGCRQCEPQGDWPYDQITSPTGAVEPFFDGDRR